MAVESKKPLKIGDIVRATGLTERMIRHYEDMGIICPSRSAAGTRRYSQSDIRIIQLISLSRAVDIPLDTMVTLATERLSYHSGRESASAMSLHLDTLADSLRLRAEHANRLRELILQARETIDDCMDCNKPPGADTCPECPMNMASKSNAVAALIWNLKRH